MPTYEFGILNLPGSNFRAVEYWLKRAGVTSLKVDDGMALSEIDCLVLPGVGSFDRAMAYIDNLGMRDDLVEFSHSRKLMIGICLGMQILFEGSMEGVSKGLGILKGQVTLLPTGKTRVPNIGWRTISSTAELGSELTKFFFMHSYGCLYDDIVAKNTLDVIETIENNETIVAGFRKGTLIGMQYHPEKSYFAGDEVIARLVNEFEGNSKSSRI